MTLMMLIATQLFVVFMALSILISVTGQNRWPLWLRTTVLAGIFISRIIGITDGMGALMALLILGICCQLLLTAPEWARGLLFLKLTKNRQHAEEIAKRFGVTHEPGPRRLALIGTAVIILITASARWIYHTNN